MAAATALVLPFAIGGSAVVGLWLAGRALAPMREAAARARSARAASAELTLPLRGTDDEWDELAGVLNDLLCEQKASIAREKEFGANAAHELRTPLTAMLGEVQVTLRRGRTEAEYRAALEALEADVQRLSSLVDALLTLGRADSGQLRAACDPFDLAALTRSAVDRVRRESPGPVVAIDVEATTSPVMGDPILTSRIVENLVRNALRHGAAPVSVRVASHEGLGVATVTDHGPGLPPAIRARLFERFNKVEDSRDGFGLGLAIAHTLALMQRGNLRFDGRAGRTSFGLELPGAVGSSAADVPVTCETTDVARASAPSSAAAPSSRE